MKAAWISVETEKGEVDERYLGGKLTSKANLDIRLVLGTEGKQEEKKGRYRLTFLTQATPRILH